MAYNGITKQAIMRDLMAEIKGGPEKEQDRGTKAEHGIGRDDAGMDDRGTKAEHGIGKEDEGMGDRGTKAELGSDDDTEWLKDPKAGPAAIDVGPTVRESADKDDPAAVISPDFQEGPESIDADAEDGDWDDDAPEMEADFDMGDEEDEAEHQQPDRTRDSTSIQDQVANVMSAMGQGPVTETVDVAVEGQVRDQIAGAIAEQLSPAGDDDSPELPPKPDHLRGRTRIQEEDEDDMGDWDEPSDPEMEADVDIDEDVDTHEDVDTYEDVDIDDEEDDEDE